jgi:hypothetical protein
VEENRLGRFFLGRLLGKDVRRAAEEAVIVDGVRVKAGLHELDIAPINSAAEADQESFDLQTSEQFLDSSHFGHNGWTPRSTLILAGLLT